MAPEFFQKRNMMQIGKEPMEKAVISPGALYPPVDIRATASFIHSVQKPNGEIPWSVGGKTDPWDHVESAMGLTVGGFYEAAKKAYLWSSDHQLPDGSWWSYYENGRPQAGAYKDPNMTAYLAVGMLHFYLCTGDDAFLWRMWGTVSRAMDYAMRLQTAQGPIYWAERADGTIDPTALLTGSSSMYLSLSSALQIAALIGEAKPAWEFSRTRLGQAIRHKPHLFDQTKACFSMDWYYPVLCGALKGREAAERIEDHWETFTVPDWGVLCVSDRPWATMAETAELVMTLAAMGNQDAAETVFGWLADKTDGDGAFWTGLTIPDHVIYTREKTAWTAAAVLLAADILCDITPAARLFKRAHDGP